MAENIRKIKCSGCGWKGKESELLTGENPFDKDIVIYGCPTCKEIDSMDIVCDVNECWSLVTCGTPTKNGYRQTCGKHKPDKKQGR